MHNIQSGSNVAEENANEDELSDKIKPIPKMLTNNNFNVLLSMANAGGAQQNQH